MTTSSTNTTIANTSTATFDAWINEIYTNLVTNCGLTQTADTGQLANPTTVALPGTTQTSAGYYIFRFNDTLQATSPIFIKLEFGTGNTTTGPAMWITVGTGSNGSGTITGTVMTRVGVLGGSAPISTVANFTSRYCYNATQGFLGMAFKIGGSGFGNNPAVGGFFLFRSVNSAGNPTADSVMLLTNSPVAAGGNNNGVMQVISFNLSAAYLNSGPITTSTNWGCIPFSTTGTLEGTAGQIFPIFQWNGSASVPGYGITNACALCANNDISVGSTVTITVLGSVSLTYIGVGGALGGGSFLTPGSFAMTNFGLLMLWQ